MKRSQRRYHLWLRLYPKEYRSVRGDEILSTLLDTADGRRLTLGELVYVFAHASRVWARRIVLGPVKRPLPQPVRLVTWLLVGGAAVYWLGAILEHIQHHSLPQHPLPPGPVVDGLVFFGLNLLLQARRRFLYALVIAVLIYFVVGGLVKTGFSVAGLVAEVPYTALVLLLLIGWSRYMDAIRHDGSSTNVAGTV
jgi:hypothetical protein